ncbi:MAG: molybdopterin-dependent oxidoreductase, partial [Candidatus Cloacimonetes bacterium]|nr:molybdopterin-dependent oxidoreductase [Candidatus Cloacimonadota bacterium]
MNKPAWRNDAHAKVTGRARYTDDLKLPGLLHAVPVYSELPRARLLSVDAAEALTQPGVMAVFTAKDIPGNQHFGQIIPDYPTLAGEDINSTGDVLALIVAETRDQAIAAIPFVKVDLEPRTPIFDPEAALKPEAEILHLFHGSNITNHHRVRRGDVAAAEREADIIIEEEFSTQRIEHAYMEPETALCQLRPDGVMEV